MTLLCLPFHAIPLLCKPNHSYPISHCFPPRSLPIQAFAIPTDPSPLANPLRSIPIKSAPFPTYPVPSDPPPLANPVRCIPFHTYPVPLADHCPSNHHPSNACCSHPDLSDPFILPLSKIHLCDTSRKSGENRQFLPVSPPALQFRATSPGKGIPVRKPKPETSFSIPRKTPGGFA